MEVTLIIEKDSPLQHLFTSASGIPARNILTAMRNCEEKNKFSVKKTDTLQATVHHVSVLTREIIERFKVRAGKPCITLCPSMIHPLILTLKIKQKTKRLVTSTTHRQLDRYTYAGCRSEFIESFIIIFPFCYSYS